MTTTEQQIDESSVRKPIGYERLFWYVPSRIIFARFKVRGKQVRTSLKTANVALAQSKLAELERNERAIAQVQDRATMRQEMATESTQPSVGLRLKTIGTGKFGQHMQRRPGGRTGI